MKRKNKKFWDYVFLSICVVWAVLIEVLCIALLEPHYLEFITTIGVFFIPLMSSIECILVLLYLFVFKFPTIKDLKNKLAEVYKRDNIHKEDFDIIAEGLDNAQKRQLGIEKEEKIQEIRDKKEIQQEKNKLIAEKIDIIKNVINDEVDRKINVKTEKNKKEVSDFERRMVSY